MFRLFGRDERGSIGTVLALGSITLLGAISASLDYSRMTHSRASLAAAVDAAALAAAQADNNKMTAVARQVFDANFREADKVTGFSAVKVKIDSEERIRVEATADVQMSLAQTVGITSAPVRAFSEVVVGFDADVQIALVLDVTGSMDGGKLTALKNAASGMVNDLYDKLKKANQVKMAVVPFAEYVNVGLSNRNQPWISVPNDSSSTQQVCWMTADVISATNCRTVTDTYNSCNDGVCTPRTNTYQTCDYTYGPSYQKCGPKSDTLTWNGCVGSRNYPLNVQDANYTINRVPGVMNVNCPPEITPLSSSRPTVLNAISALSAGGFTYIPSGLKWGWAVLSPATPYSEPVNPNREVIRYLVLMTDGENTRSPTYPYHDGSTTMTSDTLTAELCTNIKAAGIQVFTISFDVNNNLIKNQLRICASSPDQYFDATNATQLTAAFEGITKQLTQLRLTK